MYDIYIYMYMKVVVVYAKYILGYNMGYIGMVKILIEIHAVRIEFRLNISGASAEMMMMMMMMMMTFDNKNCGMCLFKKRVLQIIWRIIYIYTYS